MTASEKPGRKGKSKKTAAQGRPFLGDARGSDPEVTLESLMFPVEKQAIHREVSGAPGEKPQTAPIDGWSAIVAPKTGQVFCVVTSNYRLVTNKQAYELAKEAFSILFESLDVDKDMVVYNVIAPSTLSSCHVDLIHREFKVNLWKREVYLPFLRVTNSYNRTHKLHFEVGFARELDRGAMIFEKEVIEYKAAHTHQAILGPVKFVGDGARMRELMAQFEAYMNDLNRIEVPPDFAIPLVMKALGLTLAPRTKGARSSDARRLRDAFAASAGAALLKSSHKSGHTAYAAVVAATQVATRPPLELGQRWDSHMLQRAVGLWARDFPRQVRSSGFSLAEYLRAEIEQLDQSGTRG